MYHKLSSEDRDDDRGLELSGAGEDMTLKLFYKEKSYELKGVTPNTTIAELKQLVFQLTDTPIVSQRLIAAGKPLKPDDRTLASFKISNQSSIHLFPIPVAAAVAASPIVAVDATGVAPHNVYNLNNNNTVYNPMDPHRQHNNINFDAIRGELAIETDPVIGQTSREVKLWSMILLFLSSMTLFNNLSYITSTGRLGVSVLDSMVTLADTLCSALGIYVGQMGINSARTADMSMIKKYVKWLTILAVGSVAMRILWVLDVISQVQAAVDKSQEEGDSSGSTGGSTGGSSGSSGSDGSDQEHHPLSKKLIVTFAIQATIIALVIISAWMNCVRRAYQFRNSVQAYYVVTGTENV